MDSVLNTVKTMLGIEEDYTAFDTEIIVNINSVLMNLSQIGVVSSGTTIDSEQETWDDILEDRTDLDGVKTYIYLKVRELFDPPASSSAMEALKASISETEWRLSVRVDGDV